VIGLLQMDTCLIAAQIHEIIGVVEKASSQVAGVLQQSHFALGPV